MKLGVVEILIKILAAVHHPLLPHGYQKWPHMSSQQTPITFWELEMKDSVAVSVRIGQMTVPMEIPSCIPSKMVQIMFLSISTLSTGGQSLTTGLSTGWIATCSRLAIQHLQRPLVVPHVIATWNKCWNACFYAVSSNKVTGVVMQYVLNLGVEVVPLEGTCNMAQMVNC